MTDRQNAMPDQDGTPPRDGTSGRLYGVGLGPGDPDLMTVRAAELIGKADVVAYHSARHGRSIARSIAARYLREGQLEEPLVYPVTTETTDHPGGYRGALDEFYAEAAERLAVHLDAGRTVVVLAEGDPMFYGSYMHMHKRLAHRYPTEVVPGVTSVSAAAARLGRPLVEAEEVLTILPGTLPEEELTARLAATDSAAILKLGRTFPTVRRALERSGRLADAQFVERATMAGERTAPLAEVDPQSVPYFSLAVLPSRIGLPAEATAEPVLQAAIEPVTEAAAERTEPVGTDAAGARGQVVVVGLGPAGPLWLTPEARGELAAADELVGYTTYLDRVPVRPGQVRHGSDNKVEAERAEFALDLARRGRRVAVVSSGDPGVFAMATAVLEAACADPYREVPVRIVPGMTAAHAAASRAGAPLGHDYAVVSLSDRLKPWSAVATRLRAGGAAPLGVALYNPGPRGRRVPQGRSRRGVRRRPGARALQPGLAQPHHPGRPRPRPAARTPVAGHAGGDGPGRRRTDRAGADRHAGHPRPGRGRHADHSADRLLADPGGAARGRHRGGLDAAPLPGRPGVLSRTGSEAPRRTRPRRSHGPARPGPARPGPARPGDTSTAPPPYPPGSRRRVRGRCCAGSPRVGPRVSRWPAGTRSVTRPGARRGQEAAGCRPLCGSRPLRVDGIDGILRAITPGTSPVHSR
ncbi:hypothetical protein GCM10009665_27590 [Kitasatospora nipponensis]|uniref:Tetrapyrrole methylase domain-containing protein n=1 Tax=Kitasatospora nipponensis TaxID=258049 RepID=A0ABN1W5H1_9ACTN